MRDKHKGGKMETWECRNLQGLTKLTMQNIENPPKMRSFQKEQI